MDGSFHVVKKTYLEKYEISLPDNWMKANQIHVEEALELFFSVRTYLWWHIRFVGGLDVMPDFFLVFVC